MYQKSRQLNLKFWGFVFLRLGGGRLHTYKALLCLSLHTHMYQKEWIYDLVICEKAKPPLNRRHSNSFFFLSRHSKLVTAPLRVAQWIDVKRLHHHHRDRKRSSFLLGIHVQTALQSCFGLGLLRDKPSSYSISCSMYLCQPVFLGIYQFPFHVFAFAFAPAPSPPSSCLFSILFCSAGNLSHVSYGPT